MKQWLSRLTAVFLALILLIGTAAAESTFSDSAITAEAAILIDADTGTVLYEKNADRAMYPASTTKIMTCLLAIENGHLHDTVTIPQEAAEVPKDSSKVPVTVGEKMEMMDLLYGFMLMSGNDAANAIAVLVDGSVDAFVERMNRRAAEIGMTGTHFVNAHGYHNDGHYTTARDLAKLAQTAMESETFRKIVSTAGYVMPATNKRDSTLKVVNTNLMLLKGGEYYRKEVTGVKTGYTKSAGQTLVFAAEKNGAKLIGVLLKSNGKNDDPQRWEDASALLDYGLSRYTNYSLSELYSMSPASVQVENALESDPYGGRLELSLTNVSGSWDPACIDGDYSPAMIYMHNNTEFSVSTDLSAPIAAGTIVGTMRLTTPEGEQVTGTLVASRSVEEQPKAPSITDIFPFLEGIDLEKAGGIVKIVLIVLAALIVLRVIVSARAGAKRRRRRKKRRAGGQRSGTYYRNRYDR